MRWSLFFCFYLPYLSSIHEKANCRALICTGRPHSLGSCHFRDVRAICLPHKDKGVPFSALPKDTTSELAGLFSVTSPKCRVPSRKTADTTFWNLLVWLDKKIERQVHRLRSGRSNHYVIAWVFLFFSSFNICPTSFTIGINNFCPIVLGFSLQYGGMLHTKNKQ